ncbi:MAG TPA: hypothetical protein VFS31_18030, partial [Chitinophagaceae bacterium]|nr:hypothetical protein [Chitinophagaceae bacterium]
DPSMGSDSESLFRLCLQGKVAYLEDIVATWRIHTQNTTFTRDLDKQIREVVFIDRVAEYASSRLDKKVISRWRNHMYQMMSNHFLGMATASGRKGDIRKVLFRFFKYFNRPQITQLAARLIR